MFALVFLAGLLAQTPSVPTFPAAVELITVDAVVLDSEGHPVPGLTRDDFVVMEDGRAQEVVAFEAFGPELDTVASAEPDAPSRAEPAMSRSARAFAILLDDLSIAPPRAEGARRAATLFLEGSLRDGDEVTLGTTSGDVWWSARLPEGREDLVAVLARVKGRYVESTSLDRLTEYEAFWITTHESAPALGALQPDRSATAAAAAATPDSNPTRASIKERVKERWKLANLCTGTSCDGMVRGRAADIDLARRNRGRLTLAAVRRGVEALASVRRRKSLLFLSEGMVDDSPPAQRAVAAGARETNTAVYFVDVRGLVALPGGGSAADAEASTDLRDRFTMATEEALLETAGARSLAEETGGFSVRNTNDLAAGFGRIATESRVFYLLGFYAPEGKASPKWRKLQVQIKKRGLSVRARRGYTLRAEAEAGEGKGARKAKRPSLAPAVARALDSVHEATGLPVRAMAYVFEPRPKAATRVLVAAELDASRAAAKGQARSGRLELSILVTHRDSGREFRFDGALAVTVAAGEAPAWRALAREFDLPAGVAQARVVVRDPSTGALGSVTQRLEVPPPSTLRLSTPILTDRLQPTADGQSAPRPALAVHRNFAPAGRLYCQFEVFGAARTGEGPPRVLAGLELRTRDGRLVREAPATRIAADPDGRVVRLLGLPLDGLEEGHYELLLQVQDEGSGARLERHEPFTLAREGQE